MTAPPLLRIRNLSVRFADRRGGIFRRRSTLAIHDIDLDIQAGETFCLLGESGSGKTTLASAILGLHPFHAGQIAHNGSTINRSNDTAHQRLRADCQMVFQSPAASLNPHLTLQQSIEEPLGAKGMGSSRRRETVCELAGLAGLSEDLLGRRPGEVSGGQNQRACIARALSTRPKLLVLDEPLTALDAVARQQIVALLCRLKEAFRLTYFLITHDLALASQIGTHVAVMYLGTLVEQAPAASFFAHPYHPYAQALLSSVLRPGLWQGERIVLHGELPSLRRPPDGCVFHPRCARRLAVCTHTAPRPRMVGGGHTVCCHLFNGRPAGNDIREQRQ
ncbi:ABC transporter ATP-binding protein [Desulfosarcina ovata]|uniref:ABC transporter ATP-binding protein n=1 Tax=Desulfosarcina ovata subsp. ovata TaxID=2752305 RepID=A0A5K8AA95_9BACT|nr:ABC transporter ATP-binding protein [Desulfosarcina ovata]BBO89515.1 ABC transporter ATP-binding protein [Desulfosarcina ovata subsp. ovata]